MKGKCNVYTVSNMLLKSGTSYYVPGRNSLLHYDTWYISLHLLITDRLHFGFGTEEIYIPQKMIEGCYLWPHYIVPSHNNHWPSFISSFAFFTVIPGFLSKLVLQKKRTLFQGNCSVISILYKLQTFIQVCP